jgi:GNAT superfamily N-acetyltransferase
MAGFARLVTDASRFAWLSDVFVVPDHRGKALGQWLVETIVTCPDYRDVGLWCLATRDAHGLYAKFGFDAFDDPKRFMVRPGGARALSSEEV